MYKLIFELIKEPLGLPIEWYWEVLILGLIGIIAFTIAYDKVGEMFKLGEISSKGIGSLIHWVIRLIIFVALWAITYGVIWLVKQIIAYWLLILLAIGGIVGAIVISVLAILVLRKSKSKAVSNDA